MRRPIHATAAAISGIALSVTAVVAGSVMIAPAATTGGGGQLHFLNWDDFVDPDVVEAFETETGIDVVVTTFSDENEAVSVIQSDTARFDLLVTSASVAGEMATQRLLAEIDHAAVPNLVNIDGRFLDLPLDPGNRYSVPYTWGTTGLAYNTECISPDARSWDLLLDPSVAGRVAMDSDFSTVLGSLMKYLGHPLNSADPEHVAAVTDVLRILADEQRVVFMSWDAILDGLVSGELCVGQVFNGDAVTYMDESDVLGFFVPDEGSDFYVDSLAIPRDARNKANAERFIDFILRPEMHAANNEYIGYAVPNRASIEGGHVSQDLLSDPARYPDIDRLEGWVSFGPELRTIWNKAWARFVLSVG